MIKKSYRKFKELWKNPKTHSLLVLGLWLVFIIAVMFFIKFSSTTGTTIAKKKTDVLSNIKSYDFTYEGNNFLISGRAYNDNLLFYLDNNRYYYNGNTYIINNEKAVVSDYDIGVLKITPKLLNNLISDITPTTNKEYKEYLVSLERFINLYDIDTLVDLSQAKNYNVAVKIYTKDDLINKVILDLTNYNLFMYNNSQSSIVTIYYYNVNKVSDFSDDFDQLIEVEK